MPLPDPLFVLSRGRSGTTLLQRLLNTHEALLVLGEHDGVLREFAVAHARLVAPSAAAHFELCRHHLPAMLASEPVVEENGWSCQWTNAFTAASIDAAFRRCIVDLLLPAEARPPGLRYWGFKEIRYGTAVAQFLFRLFDEARLLVVLRDPVDTARSQLARGWWLKGTTAAEAAGSLHADWLRLCDIWTGLRSLPAAAERCRLLRYEALVQDPQAAAAGLAAWLDLTPFMPHKVSAVVGDADAADRQALEGAARHCFDLYLERFATSDRAGWAALLQDAAA